LAEFQRKQFDARQDALAPTDWNTIPPSMAQTDRHYFGVLGNPCGRDIHGAVRSAIEHRAYHFEPGLRVSGTGARRFRGDFICGAPTRMDLTNEKSDER
jgi:hypothetical protein